MNTILVFSSILLNTLLGLIAGLIIGSLIGGNYLTEFEALGNRGYEATGLIGGLLGAILALASSLYLLRHK